MTDNEKREQVARQYEVVAHLAKSLAEVHEQIEPVIRSGHQDALLDMDGNRSARLMEALGDFLNGMDAVDEEGAWTYPVFETAHKMLVDAALASPAGIEASAYQYLCRMFEHCAPQCTPLPDLVGLCTQIDNLIAGYLIRLVEIPDPAAVS